MTRLLHLYAVLIAHLRPGARTVRAAAVPAATRAGIALAGWSRVARDRLVDALPGRVRRRLGTRRSSLAAVAAIALFGVSLGVSPPTGGAAAPVAGLTPAQVDNAKAIAQVATERGLPDKAVTIGIATALQESHLDNINYGDRDSVGLFQQRPSQGWGTVGQIMDPHYSAGRFYDSLVQVPGWQNMRVTDAAQTVQRSGFPEAYQKWEPTATAITHAVTQHR